MFWQTLNLLFFRCGLCHTTSGKVAVQRWKSLKSMRQSFWRWVFAPEFCFPDVHSIKFFSRTLWTLLTKSFFKAFLNWVSVGSTTMRLLQTNRAFTAAMSSSFKWKIGDCGPHCWFLHHILQSQFMSCDFVRQFYLRNSFWVLKQVRPRQYRQLCPTYQQGTALSRLHWVPCSSCRWNMFCSPNSKTDVWLVWGTPSNSTLASCFGRGLLFVSFHPPELLWTISALHSIESHVPAGSSKYCGRACWIL